MVAPRLAIVGVPERAEKILSDSAQKSGYEAITLANPSELKEWMRRNVPDVLAFSPESDAPMLQTALEIGRNPTTSHVVMLCVVPKRSEVPAYFALFEGFNMCFITYPFPPSEADAFLERIRALLSP